MNLKFLFSNNEFKFVVVWLEQMACFGWCVTQEGFGFIRRACPRCKSRKCEAARRRSEGRTNGMHRVREREKEKKETKDLCEGPLIGACARDNEQQGRKRAEDRTLLGQKKGLDNRRAIVLSSPRSLSWLLSHSLFCVSLSSSTTNRRRLVICFHTFAAFADLRLRDLLRPFRSLRFLLVLFHSYSCAHNLARIWPIFKFGTARPINSSMNFASFYFLHFFTM